MLKIIYMKKFFCLLFTVVLFGCDDGDMTVKNFNFGDGAVLSCSEESDFIYKVNGTEAFILKIQPSSFIGVPAVRTATIPQAGFVYRNYTSTAGSSVICSELPPSTPTVAEEWTSVAGGTVKIETLERRDEDNILLGHTHTITFTSLTVTKGDEQIVLDGVIYGTFSTNLSYTFDFTDNDGNPLTPQDCDNGLVYTLKSNEVLLLDFPAGTFTEVPGEQTITLNSTNQRAILDIYTSSPGASNICNAVPPTTPTVKERWNAETGGTIKIVTTLDPLTGYRYQITLVNVNFINSDNSGEAFIVTDYDFGTYDPQ